VSRYQKGKTNVDFTEARDSEWQWHQLGRMQVCTSLQTYKHASIPPLRFLQAGCPSCRPTNSVQALKAKKACCILIQYSSTLLRRAAHPVGRQRHRVLDLSVCLCVCTCRRLLGFISLSALWLQLCGDYMSTFSVLVNQFVASFLGVIYTYRRCQPRSNYICLP